MALKRKRGTNKSNEDGGNAVKPETANEALEEKRYFLMKAEPESRIEAGKDVKFSIDDLQKVETEPWDGVRNTEASKTMRERMKLGDLAFFYHSNTKQPGIAGIAEIVREGYPDNSAWEKGHPYYDAKSDPDKPKWFRVDVKYVRHMRRFISLHELRQSSDGALKDMQLLRRPQLSVQKVSPEQWNYILKLEQQDKDDADSEHDKKPAKSRKKKKDKPMIESKPEEMDDSNRDEAVKAEIRHTHGGD